MEIWTQPQTGGPGTAVALGYFDGIHLGHRAVIEAAVREAHARGVRSAVLTFDMRARRADAKGAQDLLPYETRAALIAALGVDLLVQLDFTSIAEMTAEAFTREILGVEGLRAAAVCCGADFRYGRARSGDIDTLRAAGEALGFATRVVGEVDADGEAVSTTAIKRSLRAGEMERVAAMLGRPYGFSLEVCEDKKLARRLGFPTINQRFPARIVAPRAGVYYSRVNFGGESYPGVSNLGVRPTVGGDGAVMLETHILGFSGDLYGKTVRVELLRFMRDERRFESVEALRERVLLDVETARKLAQQQGRE